MNKVMVALDTMNIGKVLFFAYSDGSVEYRDRLTMAETFNDGDLDRVWHLSQIGFSYPDDEPCAYSLLLKYNLDRADNGKAFRLHCPLATALLYTFEMTGR